MVFFFTVASLSLAEVVLWSSQRQHIADDIVDKVRY
jgi:hypothetical protein